MTHTDTLTFGNMSRKADRTLSLVLWAKHATADVRGFVLFLALDSVLKSFISSGANHDKLASLSTDEALEFANQLREIHGKLRGILDSNRVTILKRKPWFATVISRIEERAEDLYDIVESLTLSGNAEFRDLVSECVKQISVEHGSELVGRL